MTDRLGGSGQGPWFNPIGPVQGAPAIGAPDGAVSPRRAPPPPRYASDRLEISEEAHRHFAALIDGAGAGADPELMLHLQLVHGPNSPLFDGLRDSVAGRERLAGPAGPPPAGSPGLLPPGQPDDATPLARFFSGMLAEVGFAWRNFAETQRW